MALNLITAPTAKPLIPTDVGDQIRADITDESMLIDLYISAITAKAESYIKRALITQTWELSLDMFPINQSRFIASQRINGIALPMSPVQSIVSVKYIDINGTEQTLASMEYSLTGDDPNVLVSGYNKFWPDYRMQPGAIKIRYTAGYGNEATDIPEGIRAWILMNVASLYENRESVVIGKGALVELTTLADGLLNDYVLRAF
jgi:uncharacterized phiE125 gp8 family phage protein